MSEKNQKAAGTPPPPRESRQWARFERPRAFNTAMAMVESGAMPPGLMLTWLREERGLTLRAVADLIGVSHPYWSDVEHGRTGLAPPRYTAAAGALGTSESTVARIMDFLPCGYCGRSGTPRPARRAPPGFPMVSKGENRG